MTEPRSTLDDCLHDLTAGRAIVLREDPELATRTALVFAAGAATTELCAFAIRHTSGLLTATLSFQRATQLGIPALAPSFFAAEQWCVSVDAADDITTGISAADRGLTARLLSRESSTADSFRRPGHLMVLALDPQARTPGFAGAATALAVCAGLPHTIVMADLVGLSNPTGLANLDDAAAFANLHSLPLADAGDIRRRVAAESDGRVPSHH
ncbi:3,4-dihydroxy-2-butanone-4-phosphate synthase [Nocardia sp. NPDC059239]|uniref:3,4-dihydroxy-2-butanone-4-phosphate synthase n=1 Tax=unclassified Nocardia TaxID=2637762 RepID=UPI0036742561